MASFSTNLLVAQFLVVIANSAVCSLGSSQIAGALTNNSMTKRVMVVNNNGSSSQTNLSELQQARNSVQAVPPRIVTTPVVDSQVYELRLQMIKIQILKKLQMEHEPSYIARPDVSLPEPLADLSIDDSKPENEYAEQFRGKKTQVIVMVDKVSNKTPTAVGQSRVTNRLSLSFRFTPKVYRSSIDSAFLWIRKRQNSNLGERNVHISLEEDATGLSPQKRKRKRQITTTIKSKGSWLLLSLKKVVQEWSEKDRGKNAPNSTSFLHTLEVSCTNCQPNSLLATRAKDRPFLVIDVSSAKEQTPRRKRSIECATHVKDCCRERFYVAFKDLHWSSWIVQPKGFYANYCKGSCKGSFASKYHHTFLMKKLSVYQANLEPCCAPTKLSGLSLIYFGPGPHTGTNTLIKRDLPDMRVDECGCT